MSEVASPVSTGPPELRRLSLRANFKWTFAGNAVHALCNYGIIAVLAKWGSPETVGRFTLGLAIAAPVLGATMLQLRQVQVTDARDEYYFEHYFGTRIFMSVVALLIIVGCALLGPYEGPTVWVIFLVGLGKCIESVGEIIRGLFQRHERMNLSATGFAASGLLGLAGAAGLQILTGSLTLAVAGLVTAWSLVMALYYLPQAFRLLQQRSQVEGRPHRLRPSFDFGLLARLLWRALPAGAGGFLFALSFSIPRYVLEGYHGEGLLGYYAALAYFVAAAAIVVSAMGQSASPRLATYFASDLRAYRRLLRKLVFIALGMGGALIVGVAVLGKPLVSLLYQPDYAEYQLELIILAVSGACQFLLFFGGVALMATRTFYVHTISGVVACVTTLTMSCVLIPTHGIRGAALAALAGSLISLPCYFGGVFWLMARRRRKQAIGESEIRGASSAERGGHGFAANGARPPATR